MGTKKVLERVAHNLERERENDGFFWEEEVFASRRVVISGSCSLPSSSSSRFGGFVDKGIKKSKDYDWKKEIHGGTKVTSSLDSIQTPNIPSGGRKNNNKKRNYH